MKTTTIISGFISIILTVTPLVTTAQSIDQLQKNIKKSEREIEINNALLKTSKKDENLTLNQLKITRSNIHNRKAIIKTLGRQVESINSGINSENLKISDLNREVATLKSEYSKMVVTAYKNYKLNNYLLFLFASKDFNDATKRISYMKRYNNLREVKAEQIGELRSEIEDKIKGLNKKHIALSNTTSSRKRELQVLNRDESQYKANVQSHQNKQNSITRKLKAQEKERAKAQKRLEEIIAEESRKNKNANKSDAEQKYGVELSGRFDQNIGKLPYPIRGGAIVDRFGIHPHPTISGLKVNNKGINIAGKSGSSVYCIFEGVVSSIFFIQGLNNCIMVRHGNYVSVYSNVSSVSVTMGQKVTLNQPLGKLSSSPNSDDWVLHFGIWKETTILNPEGYLKR